MKNGNRREQIPSWSHRLGAVGKTYGHTLSWFHEVVPYDKKGNYDWEPILSADLVLVCVDTPLGPDGRLNCGNVDDVLDRLQREDSLGRSRFVAH